MVNRPGQSTQTPLHQQFKIDRAGIVRTEAVVERVSEPRDVEEVRASII